MSQQNQHLTHATLRKPATKTPKQFQTNIVLQHAGGAGDIESDGVPRACHSVGLAKALRFVKAVLVLAKKVTAAISFGGRKHFSILDSKKWSSPVALKACCSNKPFDPLAPCKELRVSSSLQGSTLPKNGIATRYRFSLWTGPFRLCFQFPFNSRQDQKRARQI